MPSTEQERARNSYKSAVEDAKRQILIMQALLETNEEIPLAESTDSEDEPHLTEEERAILEDSYERTTSEQLFDEVR